jgi:16S rRNA (uracil1498-N3)-methyltransferase
VRESSSRFHCVYTTPSCGHRARILTRLSPKSGGKSAALHIASFSVFPLRIALRPHVQVAASISLRASAFSASLRYLFLSATVTIARVRRRFFVQQFNGDTAAVEGDTAYHLGRVLRAQPGQLYELSDGQRVRLGRIQKVARDRIDFALLEEIPAHQSTLDITLFLSVVKFDSFEWAIEKATELGVSTIVPLAAARSEKVLLTAAEKRADRWNKILAEAAQQSRRVSVPALQRLVQPVQAFTACADTSIKIILSERTDAPPLRRVLPAESVRPQAVLAIGPEGGWTDAEFAAAQSVAFREASLGKLILRTETAVAAALASLNYALSD